MKKISFKTAKEDLFDKLISEEQMNTLKGGAGRICSYCGQELPEEGFRCYGEFANGSGWYPSMIVNAQTYEDAKTEYLRLNGIADFSTMTVYCSMYTA